MYALNQSMKLGTEVGSDLAGGYLASFTSFILCLFCISPSILNFYGIILLEIPQRYVLPGS